MAARKTPSKGAKPDKSMRDALSLELHREDTIDGKPITRYRQVAAAMVKKGIAGDSVVLKEIFDRMDGKVSQGGIAVDIGDNPQGASITVRFVAPDEDE